MWATARNHHYIPLVQRLILLSLLPFLSGPEPVLTGESIDRAPTFGAFWLRRRHLAREITRDKNSPPLQVRPLSLLRCFRAEDEAQTRDPQLGRLMLYQLSYFRNTTYLKKRDPQVTSSILSAPPCGDLRDLVGALPGLRPTSGGKADALPTELLPQYFYVLKTRPSGYLLDLIRTALRRLAGSRRCSPPAFGRRRVGS